MLSCERRVGLGVFISNTNFLLCYMDGKAQTSSQHSPCPGRLYIQPPCLPPCYYTYCHPLVGQPALIISCVFSLPQGSGPRPRATKHLLCPMIQVCWACCCLKRTLCLLSSIQVSSDPSMYIEVENEVTAVGGVKLSRLKCNREGKEWETVLTSRILTAAGSW